MNKNVFAACFLQEKPISLQEKVIRVKASLASLKLARRKDKKQFKKGTGAWKISLDHKKMSAKRRASQAPQIVVEIGDGTVCL